MLAALNVNTKKAPQGAGKHCGAVLKRVSKTRISLHPTGIL